MASATNSLTPMMNNRKYKNSLQQVIRSSFFRLTAAVSITFTIVSVGLINFTEYKLFIPHLQHDFEQMIQIHEKQPGSIVNRFDDSVFYRVDDNNMDLLPDYLRELDVGSHEVFYDNEAFHILVKEDSQFRYLFEINQSDFETMERIIIGFINIAMFLSWVVAIIAGRHLSKKILDPIQLLSDKIRTMDQAATSTRLSDDFVNDEVGQLAHFFDEYNQKINVFLIREKLFTSDVSHELRTPLMVISSTCELLLAKNDNSSKDYSHLLKIQSACQEMKTLVSIFLSLARNENINSKLDTPQNILNKQYLKFQPIAQEKNLLLTFKDNSTSQQQYSEEFLTIVISNLLRNAIKYTINGEIQIILNNDGFSIHDSGPGIPDEIKNSVFEPFVRAQTSSARGIGLGLSIVKRICEKTDWKIHLETEDKKGTSITIIF